MAAAYGGHLECLKYMVESRCPFAYWRAGGEFNFLNDDDCNRLGWPIHENCVEYFRTIRTVDHWLRFVAPAIEPIKNTELSELARLVFNFIDGTFHRDFQFLVDRDIDEVLELQKHLW